MRVIVLAALCGLVAAQPASARSSHHRHYRHHRAHISHGHGAGMPITAQSDSIRINAVGEVISKPTPVIRKERKFDQKARGELSKQPPAALPPSSTGTGLSLRP